MKVYAPNVVNFLKIKLKALNTSLQGLLAQSKVDIDSDSYDQAQRLQGFIQGIEFAIKKISEAKK